VVLQNINHCDYVRTQECPLDSRDVVPGFIQDAGVGLLLEKEKDGY